MHIISHYSPHMVYISDPQPVGRGPVPGLDTIRSNNNDGVGDHCATPSDWAVKISLYK